MTEITQKQLDIMYASCSKMHTHSSPFELDELISESYIALSETVARKGSSKYIRVDSIVKWTYLRMLREHQKAGFVVPDRRISELPNSERRDMDSIGEVNAIGEFIENKPKRRYKGR